MRYFSTLLASRFSTFSQPTGQSKAGAMSATYLQRLKELEQENLELKRANAILRNAAGFFAQTEIEPPA